MALGFGLNRMAGVRMPSVALGFGASVDALPVSRSEDALARSPDLPEDDGPVAAGGERTGVGGVDGMPRLVGRRRGKMQARV